jgi:hypothetical protein
MNNILNSNERGCADLVAPTMKQMGLILGSSDPNNHDCATKAGPMVTDNGL